MQAIPDSINKQHGISLYYQIAELIRNRIQNGDWRVGDRLPSEFELAEQFDVSRATVRQAILELVQKGMLVRKHGSGTYVARPSFDSEFAGFHFPSELGGYHELVNYSEKPCDVKIAHQLQLAEGTTIGIAYQRRYIGSGQIIGMHTIYIKREYGMHVAKTTQAELNYEYIQQAAQIDFIRVEKKIKPVLVAEQEVKLLKNTVNVGDPALLLARTYYTYHDNPVYYCESIICADFCEFLNIP